jgi:hypothetical protein
MMGVRKHRFVPMSELWNSIRIIILAKPIISVKWLLPFKDINRASND